ncbi:MAG TPA: bifunctional methylenetetrahydrofolate dehydrogenase/methenyltetrahydrofolate cyclohydrolase, partial [Candidatus Dojkabacteria bacterium]|nr:bifunctional methylenetetrahydrofolate dehydrogenase/methenyltetrahydrofolate cyclohydrolase [Candidatus Dojkabacteria bacterium]
QDCRNLKQDVIIIDSGYSIVDGVVTGDVEIEAVKEKASWLTPVPGGIGPLGVAMLMQNTYDAFLSFQGTSHQP